MILLFFLAFSLFQGDEIATADFRADATIPRAGQPVELTLTVTLPPGYALVEWPEFPAIWGEFEVDDVGERTETITDGEREFTQQLTVRLWRPGDYQTPETFLGYQTPAGELFRIPIRPVFFTVPSVVDQDDLTLRSDRGPLRVFFVPLWLIAAVIVGVGGLGLYARRRWRQQRVIRTSQVTLTPAQVAERKLAVLEPEETEVATAVLRSYLHARLDLPSTSMTTEEILESVPVSERLVAHLREIFDYADLIRYANIEVKASPAYIEMIRAWIAEADLDG